MTCLSGVDARNYPSAQAAIDQNEGKPIQFPGTWSLSAPLTVQGDSTQILGCGPDTTFTFNQCAGFKFAPPDPLSSDTLHSGRLRDCRIQYIGSQIVPDAYAIDTVKCNEFLCSGVLAYGWHYGLRLAGDIASKFSEFEFASPLPLPTIPGSSLIHFSTALNLGGSYERTIATQLTNFNLYGLAGNSGNGPEALIRYGAGDGVSLAQSYSAGGRYGILVEPENGLSITGLNSFSQFYHDGLNTSEKGLFVRQGDGIVGDMVFASSLLANYTGACVDIDGPVGRIIADRTVRMANAPIGIDSIGASGSLYMGDTIITGCPVRVTETGLPLISTLPGDFNAALGAGVELFGVSGGVSWADNNSKFVYMSVGTVTWFKASIRGTPTYTKSGLVCFKPTGGPLPKVSHYYPVHVRSNDWALPVGATSVYAAMGPDGIFLYAEIGPGKAGVPLSSAHIPSGKEAFFEFSSGSYRNT